MHSFVSPEHKEHCPHCGVMMAVKIAENWDLPLFRTVDGEWGELSHGVSVHWGTCPACLDLILDLVWWLKTPDGPDDGEVTRVERIYPAGRGLPPVPPEVPAGIRDEYLEAARVAHLSPRASAALCRRCLQLALRDQGFSAKTLAKEIELAERDARSTPLLVEKLQIVRNVGNYAAHPTADGEGNHLEVAPGELDALFAALDDFFDAFYVRPERHARTKAEINDKLVKAGKPPIQATGGISWIEIHASSPPTDSHAVPGRKHLVHDCDKADGQEAARQERHRNERRRPLNQFDQSPRRGCHLGPPL